MLQLIRILVLPTLWLRPVRTAVSVLGIGSGVALYVAVAIINSSVQAYFAEGVRAMAGEASVVVTAEGGGIPEADLARLQAVPGVRHAVPVVVSPALASGGGPQASRWVTVLGIDPERETLVRRYRFDTEGVTSFDLLHDPDAVMVTKQVAESHGLRVGAELELMTQVGLDRFRVQGVLSPLGAGIAQGGAVVLVRLPVAQRMLGHAGRFSRIDIVTAAGSDPEAVRAAVGRMLGPGMRVERPDAQIQQLNRTVSAYQTLLVFLSVLALLVGILVMASVIGLSLAERRWEFGTLRALGATRWQVFALVEAEALGMGLLGAALGIAAGRGLAVLLVDSVSRTIANQYLTPVVVGQLRYGLATALLHAGLCVALAGLGATWVGYRTTRVPPMEAIRERELGTGGLGSRWTNWTGAVGMAFLLAVAGTLALGLHRGRPTLQGLSVGVTVVASILVAPWLAILGLRLLRPLWARNELTDRRGALYLAAAGIVRLTGRTGSNVLSLIVGLLLIVTAATLQNSFARSMEDWLDRIVPVDLVISSPGRLFMLDVQPLDEGLRAKIAVIPGVDARNADDVGGMRFVQHRYQGATIGIKAFDLPHPRQRGLPFDMRELAPGVREADLFRVGRPAALVSDTFARAYGKHPGDTLRLDTPEGPADFEILGEMVDFASPSGVIYLSRDVYKRLWGDRQVTAFTAMVQPGTPVREVADRINRTLGESQGLYASDSRELHTQLREILAETFSYTYAIEGAALLVGLLGLFHTTLASVISRTREIGLLRAVGMTRSSVRWMIVAEAVLQSVFGALAALACGLFLAYLSLTGAIATLMGRTVAFQPPWHLLFAVTGLGVAIGILASIIPAAHSSRIEIKEALGYE